ncbi:MAG TPA: cupin domain-containing protein [Solirubrobacterales bacterium]|jgi:quercetin dioxygenase-like cupin family protein|nr:cupin domain-containing protein [Solirubrobacterales bacterium]
MASGYTIKHRDEFESMEGSGESTWMLARKALGTSAFGFNLVEIAPGGGIPEHTEAGSGQVELYVILEGEAVLRIEGEDHPAPAGTFASVEPPASRTILNRSDAPVTAMLIGVQPQGGYEPMSWG